MSGKENFNKIRVESEKLLLLEDSLGWDRARLMSVENKAKAFSSLFNILSKPNPEDIEIVYEEKRYEAFWHVVGNSQFEYKKRNKYRVAVSPEVADVEILEKNFVVEGEGNFFEIESVERCRENYREEMMIDANTDEPGDFIKYLRCPQRQIVSTDELIKDGTLVANLETRANALVRRVLQALVKPIKADEILYEDITVHDLNLYFYPVYTFEYHWKTKDKKVTVAFDGVTGEVNLKAAKISDRLSRNFTSDDLFEFSKELAASLVPGAGLAMMMGKKIVQITKKK